MRKTLHLSCGAVVVVPGPTMSTILIRVQRPTDIFWGLPKGHVLPGESFARATLRETCEETGIARSQVQLASYLGRIHYEFFSYEPERTFNEKDVHFFLVLARREFPALTSETAGEGILEVRWMPLAEAIEQVSYDDYRRMLVVAQRALHLSELSEKDRAETLDTVSKPYTMGA